MQLIKNIADKERKRNKEQQDKQKTNKDNKFVYLQ